ncbi:MAG: prepilin-type N-terminal cleavage/methylation domain-containing protein [Candidatus Omnitrophota bacterium]
MHVTGYNQKKAFTIIEAIVVMALLVIISVGGASLMFYFIQNSVFMPTQMNVDMIVSDALDILIEGEGKIGGLRFSREITLAQPNEIIFVDQDGQKIRYYLYGLPSKLYRGFDIGHSIELIPYYVPTGVTLGPRGKALFTYYDANDNITMNPALVRRIAIGLVAQTGSGSYENWDGHSEQVTSITVKKFQ